VEKARKRKRQVPDCEEDSKRFVYNALPYLFKIENSRVVLVASF
jgi:hypothetical protein